jgi:hypothetical protein
MFVISATSISHHGALSDAGLARSDEGPHTTEITPDPVRGNPPKLAPASEIVTPSVDLVIGVQEITPGLHRVLRRPKRLHAVDRNDCAGDDFSVFHVGAVQGRYRFQRHGAQCLPRTRVYTDPGRVALFRYDARKLQAYALWEPQREPQSRRYAR